MRSITCMLAALVLLAACGDEGGLPSPPAPIDKLELTLDKAGAFQMVAVVEEERTEIAAGNPLLGTAREAEDVLAALTAALTVATDDARIRESDRGSLLRVFVTADPATPWKPLQWVLQCCAHPSVRIWRVSLRTDATAEYLPVDLPHDTGLNDDLYMAEANQDVPMPGDDREPLRKVVVKMFRKQRADPESAFTRMRVGGRRTGRTLDLPPTARPDPTRETRVWIELTKLLRFAYEAELDQYGEISAPPPDGGYVPTADVLRVARILTEIGYERLHLDGAPPPIHEDR